MSFFKRKVRGFETYGESEEHKELRHKRKEAFNKFTARLAVGAVNIAKKIGQKSPEQIELEKARREAYHEESIRQERLKAVRMAKQRYNPQSVQMVNPMMGSMFDMGQPVTNKRKKKKSNEIPFALRF